MKSLLSDKEISEPEENDYFDWISCGQLFRYDKFQLRTDYDSGEDTVKEIYTTQEDEENYSFKEGSKLSDILDKRLYGVDLVNDRRLAVMVSRNEI